MRRDVAQGTAKVVHEISDIRQMRRGAEGISARRVIGGDVAARAMGKNVVRFIIPGLMAAALLVNTNISNVSAKYVMTEPPKYYANLETDFMVTRIVPAEGTVEATETLMDGHDYHNIYHINLAFGSDPSDYELSQLRYISKAGDTTIFNDNAIMGGNWIDGRSEDITRDFKRKGGTIAGNTTGRMYFVAVYSDFKTDFGRIDYSRCINSSVFQSGEATECRVERLGNGKIQYQPYTAGGVRAEIPAEEDAELTALTERFVYSSGDWPAEYEWVEDELENGDNSNSGDNGDDGSNGSDEGTGDEGSGNDTGNNSGTNNNGDVNGDTVTSNGNSGSGDTGSNSGAAVTDEVISDASSGAATMDGAASSISSDKSGDVSDSASSGAVTSGVSSEKSGTEPITVEIRVVDSGDAGDNAENDAENNAGTVDRGGELGVNTTEGGEDNMGVPELGKEFWNQKWVTVPLMLLAAAVAITGWWFLFFGKKKTNKERKEEK